MLHKFIIAHSLAEDFDSPPSPSQISPSSSTGLTTTPPHSRKFIGRPHDESLSLTQIHWPTLLSLHRLDTLQQGAKFVLLNQMDSTDMELECDGSCETSKTVRDEDTDAKRKTIDVDSYEREDVPNRSKIRKNVKQSMVWDHFERLKGDPNDPHAKCDTIGKTIKKNLKDSGIERVAESMGNVVEQCCRRLFHEYSITQSGSRQGCSSTSTTSTKTVSCLDANIDFDSNENAGKDFVYDTIVEEFEDDATTPFEQGSLEIDIYLLEANVRTEGDFDILRWWKMNSDRFEVLGRMARDILSISVSTVASESAFNTGGRVVDSSRCSLAPKSVDALICTQNWLNSDPIDLQIQHELEEASKFEEGFRVVLENEKELEDLPDFDKLSITN
ncbi:transposase [Cucumis melo var. makuwa]|uniref:Transposase n=1 Tax=Cucumis melo var. makuwa TaxID=1194695 RepID=A0A5A7SM58_CUCMM|nr:transposase [Cucumis melo var. makuwa]TYK06455.1 transposase [Cucumis melo var. makuwa]